MARQEPGAALGMAPKRQGSEMTLEEGRTIFLRPNWTREYLRFFELDSRRLGDSRSAHALRPALEYAICKSFPSRLAIRRMCQKCYTGPRGRLRRRYSKYHHGQGGDTLKPRDLTRPLEIELDLDSAKGDHISNVRSTEAIPAGTRAGMVARYRRAFPKVIERTTFCTATYNCHGLVFAARRAQIYESSEVHKILADDSYKKVDEARVLPGDVALYFSETGAVDHSAIVIEAPPSPPALAIPKVFSKWGNWVEIIHWANDCPWATEPGARIEYRRLILEDV